MFSLIIGTMCSAKYLGASRIRNNKASLLMSSFELETSNCNVLLGPNGEDITFMKSTNHMPKVWTIHAPASKWPQCDCPIIGQRFICKHVMKVLKMLHTDILDGAIIREASTLHGVHKANIVKMNISNIKLGNLDELK